MTDPDAFNLAHRGTLRRAKALSAAIADGLRLAFFRPLAEGRPSGSWGAVLATTLGSMALPIIVALISVGPEGQWNWYALSFALFHVPILLAAAIVAAYAIGRPAEVPRLLVAALLISIVIDCASTAASIAFDRFPAWSRLTMEFRWVGPAWMALALATFACRFVGRGGRRALVLVSGLLLVALPLGSMYRERSMWYPSYDPDDDARSGGRLGAMAEDVYYKQPSLLSQELRAVRPASEGRVNLFFIGMAGFGSQNVFRREVDAVERLVRQRFGAEGHTIRLINNSGTLLDVPIASKTSLRASLKRMGEVMDKDRDVLVLYMTSHGSENHHFSLSLWPLSFHEIDPATLRSLLDESGIRNRVVIISACYSGGFVRPLQDPNTLVITASASNRNSFGCSNEADWTYFGKAYFDEALRETHSFTKAFEIAKPKIEQRERKEGFDPSLPQMAAGANIAGTLADLERELDGGGGHDVGQFQRASATLHVQDEYDEYVGIMFTADYADELKSACELNMEMSGPEATLAKQPDAFNGLDRSPAHWRKLSAAWRIYEKELCSRAFDANTIKAIYASRVRAAMPERELESAIAFLHTPEGARWIRADREAARQESIELGRLSAGISNDLYKRYLEERDRIVEDFRKSR